MTNWSDVDLDEDTLRSSRPSGERRGQRHLPDAKTEDSEAVLPLTEVTWLALL